MGNLINCRLTHSFRMDIKHKKIPNPLYFKVRDFLREATTRFELVIRVLQTHALPLGYVATDNIYYSNVIFIRQYEMLLVYFYFIIPLWY